MSHLYAFSSNLISHQHFNPELISIFLSWKKKSNANKNLRIQDKIIDMTLSYEKG